MAIDVSAKVTEEFEITPQSNQVSIRHDGRCLWEPRFDESAARCSVDVTWFPFDVQRCELIFESWFLFDSELNITVDRSRDIFMYYFPSDEWDLTCMFLLCLSVIFTNMYSVFQKVHPSTTNDNFKISCPIPVARSSTMNYLKSKLRYSTQIRNAKATNGGEFADFTDFAQIGCHGNFPRAIEKESQSFIYHTVTIW